MKRPAFSEAQTERLLEVVDLILRRVRLVHADCLRIEQQSTGRKLRPTALYNLELQIARKILSEPRIGEQV